LPAVLEFLKIVKPPPIFLLVAEPAELCSVKKVAPARVGFPAVKVLTISAVPPLLLPRKRVCPKLTFTINALPAVLSSRNTVPPRMELLLLRITAEPAVL
jgi:hypothetical protein